MRMRLKSRKMTNKRKHRFTNKLLIILMIILFLIILLLRYMNTVVEPYLDEVTQIEAEKISHIIIDYSIEEELKKNNFGNSFFVISNDNNFKSIDLDNVMINKLLLSIISNIGNNLKKIENGNVDEIYQNNLSLASYDIDKLHGGIIAEISSGSFLGNSLLSNVGPKIPIKISLVGNISGTTNIRVTNYGINNALFEVILEINLNEMVVLPISSHKINIKHEYILATKLIQGDIPNYYFDNKNLSTMFFPIE